MIGRQLQFMLRLGRLTTLWMVVCATMLRLAPLDAQESAALAPVRIYGSVFDSLNNGPLEGATVQLIEPPPGRHSYAAISDSLGRFDIDGVRAGQYVVGFQHPLLDTLGISAPYDSIAVGEGATTRISLAVPGERMLARAICRDAATKDSVGMIVGHVLDATSGAPMPGSAVTLQWPTLVFGSGGPHTETQTLRATTTREGWFAICGLREGEYRMHAELGARATGLIDVAIRPHDVARLSLRIGGGVVASARDSVAGGGATLSGSVRSSHGHPIEGAQVAVDGSAASATTDAGGAFTLSGIPDGTRMAEARALGYEPTRVRVEPSHTEPRTVTIAMKKRVATLNEVTVFGRRTQRMRDLTGFEERRQRGFGRFMTQQDIGERNVLSVCDLLRRFAGVIVIDDGMMGCKANIRGATSGASPVGMGAVPNLCQPTLYQDNVPYNGSISELAHTVFPGDIMGIEVYTSATEPPQFPGLCGAIVVWTRMGA